MSPFFFPKSALPNGDSFEMRFEDGSVSSEPTMKYVSSFETPSFLAVTVEPKSMVEVSG